MIIPCQTFLLTLQEADDFLPQLASSSLDFQILDPKILGENWETSEINYNFRNWQNKIEILDKILVGNRSKWQSWQKYFAKKPNFKIEKNILEKNLEIAILYTNYKEILDLITEVELVRINLEDNKNDTFFGQDIEEFTLEFVTFAKNVVTKINNQKKIDLIEKPLINSIICQNLIAQNSTKKQETQKTEGPTDKKQNRQKDEQITQQKLENSQQNNEENKLNENFKKWQVLFCPKNLSQDLVIFAQKKNINLLDFEEMKITLEKEKFALEKKLKTLDFEPKKYLTKSQTKIFEKTILQLKIEQKVNYYRFQTTKNIPANYKKSQIIIAQNELQKARPVDKEDKKPELSFAVIAFPESQIKLFFDKIKSFKIAFAQINNENLVFWHFLPNSIDNFVFKLINFPQLSTILPIIFQKNTQRNQNIRQTTLSPKNNSGDPSFIFLNFLIFNLAITLGNFDTGFYLLITSILLFFWARGLAIFTFLTAILTIFFGLLFGNFGTNLFIINLFKINSNIFNSFQIVSSDPISRSPINQFFGLNSSWKIAILILIFFILIGIFQFLIVKFLDKRLQSLEEKSNSKTQKDVQKQTQNSDKPKYIYFILYILLSLIFGSQFYFNSWLNFLISQNIFWTIISPLFVLIQFIFAFLTSLLTVKYFLLSQFYKPTAKLLQPEKDNF